MIHDLLNPFNSPRIGFSKDLAPTALARRFFLLQQGPFKRVDDEDPHRLALQRGSRLDFSYQGIRQIQCRFH